MPDVIEVNVKTGEQTTRAMTAEEVAAAEAAAAAESSMPVDIRAQILSVSQQALASGFLHVMMFDLMQRYLQQAQAIVPTVTEADLLDVNGPYYSKPYADMRSYYVQLVALQDAK